MPGPGGCLRHQWHLRGGPPPLTRGSRRPDDAAEDSQEEVRHTVIVLVSRPHKRPPMPSAAPPPCARPPAHADGRPRTGTAGTARGGVGGSGDLGIPLEIIEDPYRDLTDHGDGLPGRGRRPLGGRHDHRRHPGFRRSSLVSALHDASTPAARPASSTARDTVVASVPWHMRDPPGAGGTVEWLVEREVELEDVDAGSPGTQGRDRPCDRRERQHLGEGEARSRRHGRPAAGRWRRRCADRVPGPTRSPRRLARARRGRGRSSRYAPPDRRCRWSTHRRRPSRDRPPRRGASLAAVVRA